MVGENTYVSTTNIICMASIPTPAVIQMRDRIFVGPNLVLWLMVWPLAFLSDAFLSDLGNVLLYVPFLLSYLGMSIFVFYDEEKSDGWSTTMRTLWETTPIKRFLLAAVLIIAAIAVWFVSTYNESLSWVGWNTMAAFTLFYSYSIVPSSPNAPEQMN